MSKPCRTRQAIRPWREYLTILVHVARADGLFHQDERDVIDAFLDARCRSYNYDPVKAYRTVRALKPTEDCFADAIARVEAMPHRRRRLLLKACRRVIAADGRTTPREARLMHWLETRLG